MKRKTEFLTVRVDSSELERFKQHCSEKLNRKNSDVIREMITALCDGRLTIKPTEAMKGMYK